MAYSQVRLLNTLCDLQNYAVDRDKLKAIVDSFTIL